MSRIPSVAIIGRPNVGKSSLFNRLCGSRVAIEDPRPGTTRDRVSFHWRVNDRLVELVDAAGVGMIDDQNLEVDIEAQINFAVAQADIMLMVVDTKEGLLPLDRDVARLLRGADKPVLLVANKADAPHQDHMVGEFHALGLGEPVTVSAHQNRGIDELIWWMLENLPPRTDAEEVSEPVMKLAIVGKRNSGKSSLVNFLANDSRVIVSEIPGTTRDSVDVQFDYKGMRFTAIDTAGLQRSRSMDNSVEFFSQARSMRAVRRADVVILMMDATSDTSRLDQTLAEEAMIKLKPVIVAVNKWDLAGDTEPDRFIKYINRKLPMLDFAPVVFTSTKTGQNCSELVELALKLHRQGNTRVTTGELNRVVRAAFDKHRPKARGGRPPRLFYATQSDTSPPEIVCFVNDRDMFREDWREYLKRQLRQNLPFSEVPIMVHFRNREKVELE